MAKSIKDGNLLYHLTSIDNLENIFNNGLLSRKDALNKKLIQSDIADSEIIAKRKELGIDDCVPFHFYGQTPFAGAVLKTTENKDKNFCFITIKREFAKEQNFKICTAHPLSPNAKIKDYEDGFKSIDWKNAEKRDYNDEVSKNACMAECLAASPVMPKDFSFIYVADKISKQSIEKLVEKVNKNKQDRIKLSIQINAHFFPRAKDNDGEANDD